MAGRAGCFARVDYFAISQFISLCAAYAGKASNARKCKYAKQTLRIRNILPAFVVVAGCCLMTNDNKPKNDSYFVFVLVRELKAREAAKYPSQSGWRTSKTYSTFY